MTEKEMFLATWEREFQTTVKVMKAFPVEKLDLQPSEKSNTAKNLLWTFAAEEFIVDGVTKGKIDFAGIPSAPDTLAEILSVYERNHVRNVELVKKMTDEEYQSTIPWMIAPRQMGRVRRADVLWTTLMDNVHHRGQLSVYLRLAGARVPSIYGPTADEPWM
jgi:uncharacterized damage-inducible protein DinB